MSRTILIVMDGCGAGAAPDSAAFGDEGTPNTVRHVWDACGGLELPTLDQIGFLAACGIGPDRPAAHYGRLQPLSQGGKDSVTGHWEMMGIVLADRFPTYPHGFPADLVEVFEAAIGRKVIGNRPASGTQILDELGAAHLATGSPILYTSADSVFQVAAHESIIPPAELYAICETARRLCQAPNLVQRVIARPFIGSPNAFERTGHRRDFPAPPPPNLADEIGDVYGIGVVPELFGGRGFRPTPRTQSNPEHAIALLDAISSDAQLIFANFEDFDMKYGHRNDPIGFGQCLEAFDRTLQDILTHARLDDLVLVTADHGNDPTSPSTDHSREYVPLAIFGEPPGAPFGDLRGFAQIARLIRAHNKM